MESLFFIHLGEEIRSLQKVEHTILGQILEAQKSLETCVDYHGVDDALFCIVLLEFENYSDRRGRGGKDNDKISRQLEGLLMYTK